MKLLLLALVAALALPQTARADLRAVPGIEEHLGRSGEATGTGEELAYVRQIFSEIQPWSIEINAEICGYIGYNRMGQLTRTRHSVGQEASCRLPQWPSKMVVIASYHTHSTWSRHYDSEVPSTLDMESDESSEIDGYVATPGGRLWYVDSDTMTTGQICGVGCLFQDPGFRPDPPGTIREVYSYQQLVKRERY